MPKELDNLQRAVKQQLKKDNPEMSEEDLESKAWAIAQSQYKKQRESTDKKEIIVAENVKVILDANITPITVNT